MKEPDEHFYLANLCDMEDELPSLSEFTEIVAELHQKSVSLTGRIAFHVTTYGENRPVGQHIVQLTRRFLQASDEEHHQE